MSNPQASPQGPLDDSGLRQIRTQVRALLDAGADAEAVGNDGTSAHALVAQLNDKRLSRYMPGRK